MDEPAAVSNNAGFDDALAGGRVVRIGKDLDSKGEVMDKQRDVFDEIREGGHLPADKDFDELSKGDTMLKYARFYISEDEEEYVDELQRIRPLTEESLERWIKEYNSLEPDYPLSAGKMATYLDCSVEALTDGSWYAPEHLGGEFLDGIPSEAHKVVVRSYTGAFGRWCPSMIDAWMTPDGKVWTLTDFTI